MTYTKGNVLVIAGSDSGGGAGIQADIKTITCLNGYAMTAITALTAQNTMGVEDVLEIPTDFIQKQLDVIFKDIRIDAVKIGMLGNKEIIKTVTKFIRDHIKDNNNTIPVVLDPVMIAKGGTPLLKSDANQVLINDLIPLADIITPNIPEAEAITNEKITSIDDMIAASYQLINMGATATLVKGGHMMNTNSDETSEEIVSDVLASKKTGEIDVNIFESQRIFTNNTHGTGCTLASAIATGLAQQMSTIDAIKKARKYVYEAIKSAPNIGNGHGPLNHSHTVNNF
ncbi:MAG: bifunctional hydroxymethylpyrimidine kinase/phosphomethylpyrimidine kinase [Alphaproteobacteria bacterium]|nr:bifunctional hydroxymethylpyrimidine kinase/phosphomethylpyrimidine kinase [Alphaproteobacteria bacterium]